MFGLDVIMERLDRVSAVLDALDVPSRIIAKREGLPYLETTFPNEVIGMAEYILIEGDRTEEVLLDIRGLIPSPPCSERITRQLCDQFNATSFGGFAVVGEEGVEYRVILPEAQEATQGDTLTYFLQIYLEHMSQLQQELEQGGNLQ